MADFARQPMVLAGVEEAFVGEYLIGVAGRFEHDRRDIELVEPDIENGVVKLARQAERPEIRAER